MGILSSRVSSPLFAYEFTVGPILSTTGFDFEIAMLAAETVKFSAACKKCANLKLLCQRTLKRGLRGGDPNQCKDMFLKLCVFLFKFLPTLQLFKNFGNELNIKHTQYSNLAN